MKFKKMIPTIMVISMAMSSTAFAGTWKTGAEENQNKWWYDNEDGSYANNGWYWIDGNNDGIAECYYFDSEGWLLTNAMAENSYEVNENGAWVLNGIVETREIVSETQEDTNSDIEINGEYHLTGGIINGEYMVMNPGDSEDSGYFTVSNGTIESKERNEQTGKAVQCYIKDGEKYVPISDIYPDEWTNYYCEYNYFIFEDGKLIAIIPWFDISDGNLKENRLIFEK